MAKKALHFISHQENGNQIYNETQLQTHQNIWNAKRLTILVRL